MNSFKLTWLNSSKVIKKYIDSKFGIVKGSTTLSKNSSHNIMGVGDKKIISTLIYRKRKSDSFWFLQHTNNLGFQLFERQDTLVLWNNSTDTNDFTNEFKWVITYIIE